MATPCEVPGCIVKHDSFACSHVISDNPSAEPITYEPPILAGKPLDKQAGLVKPPTPEELAHAALEPIWFEWYADRDRVEAAVAKAIREDRARVMAVVNRARILFPAILRDLTAELGGRQ